MKYIKKALALFCILTVLAGCKVELPSQHAASSAGPSESTAPVSSEIRSEAETSGISGSAPVSSAAVPQSSPKTASSGVSKAPPAKKTAVPAPQLQKETSCTLFISCGDILKNREKFSEDKLSAVPKDGIIFAEKNVKIKNGETVFDVLLRVTKADGIPMESAVSPVYQSTYIKGINNIYEKDFGASSGWTYTVNGKQPPVSCNGYKLKNGDKIQWLFVCGG
ncbi:DUF4430 domain-containing protein [Caproiciproducens galactitolivorans]|uniref:DUF4430 domain-containing protein n=1 Tax=Caproiciproducens galactitolivorans TaxID=642589 RepID=A0ABT4BU97_9FIRM|nr:DUF4430 domain-containing protein [Caproiciproducens galactitolivorans]MCY1714459.1 DUF4430 domain-containing protein [Caproiciproducens galactitolivorans]